jgi:hypothetical protein
MRLISSGSFITLSSIYDDCKDLLYTDIQQLLFAHSFHFIVVIH